MQGPSHQLMGGSVGKIPAVCLVTKRRNLAAEEVAY